MIRRCKCSGMDTQEIRCFFVGIWCSRVRSAAFRGRGRSELSAQHPLCPTPEVRHTCSLSKHRGSLTAGRLAVSGPALPWTDLPQGCQLPLLSFSSLVSGSLRLKERVSHQSRLFMSVQQTDIKVKNFRLLAFYVEYSKLMTDKSLYLYIYRFVVERIFIFYSLLQNSFGGRIDSV